MDDHLSLLREICAVFLLLLFPTLARTQDITVTPFTSLQTESKKDVTTLVVSNSVRSLLVGDSKGNIHYIDFDKRQAIAGLKLKSSIIFADLLSENKTAVGVDKRGNIAVFDLLSGQKLSTFKTGSKPLQATIDTGKRFIAVATAKQRIEIFDLRAGMLAGTIDARGKLEHLLFLGFNRLGEQLIAISERAKVVSWNPLTQRLIREVSLGSGEIHGSKSVIQSASTNRSSNIFVVGLQEVALPKGGLRGMARPGDLRRQNMVLAYDWNSGIEIKRIKFPYGKVRKITLGPGNDHVAVTNNKDKNVTLIDLRKGELAGTVTMRENPKVITVSDDDHWLAAGGSKGQISVWELNFREKATAANIGSALPSLSGRIRTQSKQGPALTPGSPVVLAILNFQAKGSIDQNLGDVGLDILTTNLANFDYISLVERSRILLIIDELKLQMSGLTDKNGARVGKLLNADKVLLCTVGAIGTSYLFSARLVDVETARVEKGRQVICEECREQDFFDAINLLASTIAQ